MIIWVCLWGHLLRSIVRLVAVIFEKYVEKYCEVRCSDIWKICWEVLWGSLRWYFYVQGKAFLLVSWNRNWTETNYIALTLYSAKLSYSDILETYPPLYRQQLGSQQPFSPRLLGNTSSLMLPPPNLFDRPPPTYLYTPPPNYFGAPPPNLMSRPPPNISERVKLDHRNRF